MTRLPQDKFRIFISHKHADAELANLVAKELEALAPGLIECWVSGRDLTAGVDWNRQIKAGLGGSHLLLLLFTVPAHQWDWCLFEVGLFMRFSQEDISAVICLFDPDGSTPGPLNQVQGVPANADAIRTRFLEPLCTETWRVSDDWLRGALIPGVDPQDLATTAETLSTGFRKALSGGSAGLYEYRPCHRIVLDLEGTSADPDWKHWTGIPSDARVLKGSEETSSYTLALFKRAEGRGDLTWGEMIEGVEQDDSPWKRDLDEAFMAALRRQLWTPTNARLEAWHPGSSERRAYMPVLYRVTSRVQDDRPVAVEMMLVPDEP